MQNRKHSQRTQQDTYAKYPTFLYQCNIKGCNRVQTADGEMNEWVIFAEHINILKAEIGRTNYTWFFLHREIFDAPQRGFSHLPKGKSPMPK